MSMQSVKKGEIVTTQSGDRLCWDLRFSLNENLTDEQIVWDIKSIFGGDLTLHDLVRQNIPHKDFFIELDKKVEAHRKASKIAHVKFQVPFSLIEEWCDSRHDILSSLFELAKAGNTMSATFVDDYKRRWPFIRALREVELGGIHVNVPFITDALRKASGEATERHLRSMLELERGGFVTSLLNPIGAKTGRLRHEGGFNSLAIPKGFAREAINSRWEGGKIVSFDFNAIDYRCIIKAVGSEMSKLYAGAKDFHERTASFVFRNVTPDTRDSIKFLSYVYIYGGSDATLVEKTGWSLENVHKALDLLNKKIEPVKNFREQMWKDAMREGFVTIPGGRQVECSKDDNQGKIIGLFAQSYSSHIFEQAFKRVHDALKHKNSKIIFSCHDELVVDCHPEEILFMDELVTLMEGDGYAVKKKIGQNYGTFQ